MTHDCNCHGGGDHRLATIVPGSLERPLYAPGLILQDSDLTAAVDYTRELNRLLFRTLFGCGVLCGLTVSIRENCGLIVTVAPGLALDGCGDPLHLPGSAVIKLEERDGVLSPAGTNGAPRFTQFWVLACAKDGKCRPRPTVCDDSLDDRTQATRARLNTEISVTIAPPTCACGCMDFSNQHGDEEGGSEGEIGSGDIEVDTPPDRVTDCYDKHNYDPACPEDCGCGSACSCGCCVLLAEVRWVENDGQNGWQVRHKGVRRFVRPALIPDPILS
ncbi:hypothetical protein [Sphingobium sp. DN12]|uniref:hypothetical protein n=1 Tax=Sphingobium sp. DN12 TaxID=3378073 RepID=UPI003DA1E14D